MMSGSSVPRRYLAGSGCGSASEEQVREMPFFVIRKAWLPSPSALCLPLSPPGDATGVRTLTFTQTYDGRHAGNFSPQKIVGARWLFVG